MDEMDLAAKVGGFGGFAVDVDGGFAREVLCHNVLFLQRYEGSLLV